MSDLKIDFPTVIAKFDQILARGLCSGVGERDGQMCIEAAICAALDLPHGDDPQCVEPAVRSYKIRLNDANWPSARARAAGLRDLGIAQIGSRGVVNGKEFARRLVDRTIRELIPALFLEVAPTNKRMQAAAERCRVEGSHAAAADAAAAACAAAAAYAAAAGAAADAAAAAAYAADAAAAACAAAAAAAYAAAACAAAAYDAAAAAAYAAAPKYLLMSAGFALDILKDLKSPGCAWFVGG